MKRQLFCVIIVLIGLLANAQQKPNLIVIHTDEHSFRTLSCYQKLLPQDQAFVWGEGVNAKTPNIDRIAEEGAICTSYYASSPVCTPSRASLVTGLYPQATGAPKNGLHLSKDVKTFGHILKDEGYSTSYVGKWHLAGNYKYTFNIEYKAGFEDNRYMMTGGHAPYLYESPDGMIGISHKKYMRLSQQEKLKCTHMTDYFFDRSLEILERDKEKPFCMVLSIPDPHTPDYARPPYNSMFEHLKPEMPETMEADKAAKRPSWAVTKPDKDHNEATEFNAEAVLQYFGMVKHIDDRVGDVLQFLDDNELAENTILVFTSDHGDMFYEHSRRNKGLPYEASARIPFVIRYPAKIPDGKVISTAYTNVDFAPTTLALMGIETNVAFHGMDASDAFTNDEASVSSDRITYFAKSGGWWVAAVDDRYKLVLDKKESPWLFDLEKDPHELNNLYYDKAYQDQVKRLKTELLSQLEKYKEPGLRTPYLLK